MGTVDNSLRSSVLTTETDVNVRIMIARAEALVGMAKRVRGC
jgi:hypothetical protein